MAAAVPGFPDAMLRYCSDVKLLKMFDDMALYRASYNGVDVVIRKMCSDSSDAAVYAEFYRHNEEVFVVTGEIMEIGVEFLYVVMLYHAPGTLYDIVYKRGLRFKEPAIKFYAAQLLVALDALHSRHILHLDIELDNMVMGMDGYIRLMGFGRSERLKAGETHSTCRSTAAERYFPPELFDCNFPSRDTDYWALGVCLLEMYSGSHPFCLFPGEVATNPVRDLLDDTFREYIRSEDHWLHIDLNYVSEEFKSLIDGLLTKDVRYRLGHIGGAKEIMAHSYFKDVNWQDLRDCEICPPLQPLSQYGGSITFDIAGYGIEKGT